MFFQTLPLDLKLFLLINQQLRCWLFDVLMPVFSSTAALLVIAAIFLTVAVYKSGRKHIVLFLVLAAGMGITDFTTGLIKDQVGRVRPLNAVAETYHMDKGEWLQRSADFVQTKEHGSSYPSAHSSNTMCLAILAMLLWPALKKWPLIIPLVAGYSRVYLGKHYPTDVLAGWLFGVITALTVWVIWKYGVSRLLEKKP